ncbi:MAG: Tim44 domain-containing protein [Burkholderiales bacterium]|nr:Tim44 domain-containing protein [Burkholderiales bacterium]
MNLSRIALVFTAALQGMTVAYAQTAGADSASVAVPASMLEQHANPWKTMLENPVVAVAIVLAVIAVVTVIVIARRRNSSSRNRYDDNGPATYVGGYETIDPRARKEPQLHTKSAANLGKTEVPPGSWSVPADFDVPRFLRKTKAYFMRLQASWDNADVKDIRRFTTRELFGEFCKQLNERGAAPSATEVVTLGAELQGVETVGEYYIATVKFTGMVKEDDAEVAPFSEVWSLSKPLDGHRSWVLAEIQQPA